jgi:hypothetical protein
MSRYYLRVRRNDHLYRDEEGEEAPTDLEITLRARETARNLIKASCRIDPGLHLRSRAATRSASARVARHREQSRNSCPQGGNERHPYRDVRPDPVGYARSLADITEAKEVTLDLAAKGSELMKELTPRLKKVAVRAALSRTSCKHRLVIVSQKHHTAFTAALVSGSIQGKPSTGSRMSKVALTAASNPHDPTASSLARQASL